MGVEMLEWVCVYCVWVRSGVMVGVCVRKGALTSGISDLII